MKQSNFAVVVPMANESADFDGFITELRNTINNFDNATVYFVVDNASKDNTLELCNHLSKEDKRFITVYEPSNKNVVDAYLRGYREAYTNGHEFIIEMDAGLSHDPKVLPMFLKALSEGKECAFGSRFIEGGSIKDSNFKRTFLSKFGTYLANILLGSRLHDMTSGYQGFQAQIVKKFLDYNLRSKAHFYQTEVRYLLRDKTYAEIPITYRMPSPSISNKAISNSIEVLMYYFIKRITFRAVIIK